MHLQRNVIFCLALTLAGLAPLEAAPRLPQAAPARLSGNYAPRQLPPEVEKEIRRLLLHPGLQSGYVGLRVTALGKAESAQKFPVSPYNGGQVAVNSRPLLSINAGKRFMPASNMKLFTAAWVLQELGPEFRFSTRVLLDGPANAGAATGLVLASAGDPSLKMEDVQGLARRARDRVRGPYSARHLGVPGLHGEHGGGRYPDGWTLDDALWGYGPSVVSGTVDRNRIGVGLVGAPFLGELPTLATSMEAPFPIDVRITTLEKGAGEVTYDFARGADGRPRLQVTGTLAVDQKVSEDVAVPDPEALLLQGFQRALDRPGETGPPPGTDQTPPVRGSELAVHHSAPLAVLLKDFLKPSDNLYGELLLRRAGLTVADGPAEAGAATAPGARVSSSGLAMRAHLAMDRWLRSQGVATRDLRFSDGSGLSRYNLLTPEAVTGLLEVVQHMPHGQVFYEALPVAGVDGTLTRRMKGTAAEGNVRAKTGTFSIANCLSGYVTTADGHRLAVAILTDFVPEGEVARSIQGRIFATLAAARFTPRAASLPR